MKYVFRILGLLLLVLIVVMLVRTFSLKSKQILPQKIELKKLRPAAIPTLRQAMRTPTVSKETQIDTTAFILLDSLIDTSYVLLDSLLEISKINQFSSIYHWRGSNPELKPILLLAHKDVVPVGPEQYSQWNHPPFAGVIEKDTLYGRGSLDDKFSLFAILEAAELLLMESFQPERSIYFAFGHDEESGGLNGAVAMANYFETQGIEFEFILDEGLLVLENALDGLKEPACLIGIAEKGYASFDLRVSLEQGGHSSMPPQKTAIGGLSRAVHLLEQFPFPADLSGVPEQTFSYLAPEMNFFRRLALANTWLTGSLLVQQLEQEASTNALIRTTLAPTMIKGGFKDNVLPDEAVATVNARIRPGESIESTLQNIKATIDDPLVEVSLSPASQHTEPPIISSATSLGFNVVQKTAKSIWPEAVVAPSLLVATTDSRYYTHLTEQTFRFLPIKLSQEDLKMLHGVNEKVALEDYKRAVNFYYQLLRNAAG